ncbi:MAG: cytochrome C oxidase subunit I [Chitinophagales bacterium]|nr:cytochrome C oxidase subunit I [Chitinophagales bacterium]MBP6153567.1 cytochrome C oxidase subunit I [Chitinophagales bacterium]
MLTSISGDVQQTTSYKVVLPFYIYAAISFLLACSLLLIHTDIIHQHYFHPQTLAITHIMALGWGTMIILGASHQLLPVLIEGKLDSYLLAHLSFWFCAIGIPMLLFGFYTFNTGWPLQIGAVLINIGIICYVVNVIASALKSKKINVHTWYMMVASCWLFATTGLGLLLVFNFSQSILPKDSLSYLSLHAHLGLLGWFLLLVIGVGSRLIPMFLISKYTNTKLLWWIFALVNIGLLSFIIIKCLEIDKMYYYISIACIFIALFLFLFYCKSAYKVRIRKNVDEQMKTSLLSVVQMLFPIIALLVSLLWLPNGKNYQLVLMYGFSFFFGWITAIILGMTFKTLPFIVWNKIYHHRAQAGKTPVPKELFSERIYAIMLIAYLLGFIIFILGIIFSINWLLKIGALSLLMAALLYVLNTGIILLHQPHKK